MRCLFLLSVMICATAAQSQAQSCPPEVELAPDQVVARWGDERLRLSDLDASVNEALCRARIEYTRAVNEIRQKALATLVDQRLLAARAQQAKVADGEVLIERDVLKKLKAPTEAVVKAFYEENKARMEGASLAEIKPQIVGYLQELSRLEARDQYLERLRREAKVDLLLPPFRLPVSSSGPARGPEKAPVVIVSFADYECPYCAAGARTLKEVQRLYPGKVRIVFKEFPLDFHAQAVPAAVAARCAGEQKKYWEMHDLLFERPGFTSDNFSAFASELGLDPKAFSTCMVNPKVAASVSADRRLGEGIGVDGTPAFFVNGIPLTGAQPVDAFVEIIRSELNQKP